VADSFFSPGSLSEYGCTTNGRDFGEIKALMSPAMSSVYSGGLLYEYTMEPNNFGIVKINGNTAQELPEFAKFAAALKANPAPTGSAGAASATKVSTCPGTDAHWLLSDLTLPAIPQKAKDVSFDRI
jgi:1,3-beta-glucanosyltransferase GAS5